jgi:adenylate cyclase
MYSGGGEGGSLQMVDAVVASPIFDGEKIVGVVYGSRDMRGLAPEGRRGIQPLEAQLVQVLAGAVSAGLARVEREAEAARTRVQFEQFVSPELAKALERDAGILAAQERELTLLFADLRGFSRISERIGAEETYHLLSDILDRFTNQIMDHGGVVIDYYGDGLAAMWNAPFDQADHAERAVQAAQAIQSELPEINVAWAERLQGVIRIGIGIHTGVSQVGNSGSRRRMKYGPRGHAVNLTSRVEAATKVFGVPCIITAATRQRLPADLPLRRLCRGRLTGMEGAIDLYELAAEAPTSQWLMQRDLYEQALVLYEKDQPAAALELVATLNTYLANDPATLLLQAHAQARLEQPEGEFEPVFKVETKM